jgi:hypothetical protein
LHRLRSVGRVVSVKHAHQVPDRAGMLLVVQRLRPFQKRDPERAPLVAGSEKVP